MKYLKRFESSSDFYTSIDFDTFSPIAKSTSLLIDFKSSDTKEIIKWCDRYNFNIQSSYKYNYGVPFLFLETKAKTKHLLFVIGYIYKTPDEWFYVCVNDNNGTAKEFYKCDQIEGVIKCLEDKVTSLMTASVFNRKYLKRFESSSDFYTSIDGVRSIRLNNLKVFNEEEFKEVEKLIANYHGLKIDKKYYQESENGRIWIKSVGPDEHKNVSICIYKTDDEWYYVAIRRPGSGYGHIGDYYWFKCDQMEGLIKCLENEIYKYWTNI